jgi:hypothetical protein
MDLSIVRGYFNGNPLFFCQIVNIGRNHCINWNKKIVGQGPVERYVILGRERYAVIAPGFGGLLAVACDHTEK